MSRLSAFVVAAMLGMVTISPGAVADGRIVEIEVRSEALAGNLIGTPTIQNAAVYLPPGYERQPDRRYPVIYLLHGIFDSYETWLVHFDIPAMFDRLIVEGRIPPLIVVMPNGGNRYGGGFYRNSPVSGNWGDYIADELVRRVDGEFRTIAEVDGRAVVGHSMGGYGALYLAMTRPGLFSSVWAMSPCCLAARDDFGFGNDAWKRAAEVETSEDLERLVASGDFYALATLGIVTAFSVEPGAPPVHGDFPFDAVRGEVVLDDDAYDRYLDALPLRQVHEARAALRVLRGLGLGVGLGDQFLHIPTGTLAFSQRLGAERIPHRLDVYAGDHREQVAERLETIVMPWIGERLMTIE